MLSLKYFKTTPEDQQEATAEEGLNSLRVKECIREVVAQCLLESINGSNFGSFCHI